VPVYFVHLSGRDAVAALDRARAHWPRVYRETCPHYLFHNVEGLVPAVKFSPPVPPSRGQRGALGRAAGGRLDCVGRCRASVSGTRLMSIVMHSGPHRSATYAVVPEPRVELGTKAPRIPSDQDVSASAYRRSRIALRSYSACSGTCQATAG